jgi:hypothetical protein
MVGEEIKKLYSAYLIPFSDESYSLILIYQPAGEETTKALFITKNLETGDERKNILKLKTDQVPPEKALDVYDFTVKDMFKRQIQSIDPGAQLLEFRFEDPQKVEDNLKLLKEKMKELELL